MKFTVHQGGNSMVPPKEIEFLYLDVKALIKMLKENESEIDSLFVYFIRPDGGGYVNVAGPMHHSMALGALDLLKDEVKKRFE